jgi:hypothetical protein
LTTSRHHLLMSHTRHTTSGTRHTHTACEWCRAT